MSLIRSAEDVGRLLGEIPHWDPQDPDRARIADVLPLDVLEAAYLKKLGALPVALAFEGGSARTLREKITVMRLIFLAWRRAGIASIGRTIAAALDESPADPDDLWYKLDQATDAALVGMLEKRYPPPK